MANNEANNIFESMRAGALSYLDNATLLAEEMKKDLTDEQKKVVDEKLNPTVIARLKKDFNGNLDDLIKQAKM